MVEESGKTYGRKPYISGEEDDYLAQMSRVPRRAMEVQERGEAPRSVFDKPYLTDNYSEMEQFQPFHIPDPLVPVDPPRPPEGGKRIGSGGDDPVPPPPSDTCEISLQSPFKCCPKSGQTCRTRGGFTYAHARVSVIPMAEHPPKKGVGNDLEEIWNNAIQVYHNGVQASTTYVKGGTWPLCIESTNGDGSWNNGDTLYAFIRGNTGDVIAEARIRVSCFKDANCCDCEDPPEGPFLFDDASTPDTITANGNISLFVQGGCAPYNWSVSGTGYSLAASSTEDPVNILYCSSGSYCDYSPTATITVTDKCEQVVTFNIRCVTNTEWGLVALYRSNAACWGSWGDFTFYGTSGYNVNDGKYKWVIPTSEGIQIGIQSTCVGATDIWQEACTELSAELYPGCGTPSECAHALAPAYDTFTQNCDMSHQFGSARLYFYEWRCIP